MKLTKGHFKLVLINALILIAVIGLMETAIRLFYPDIRLQGIDNDLVTDGVYGSTPGLKPNVSGEAMDRTVTTNQWGFRSTGRMPDTSRKSKLLLGDSVTLGVGVEDDSTFPAILQDHYEEFNLLNASFAGYAVNDYHNIVKHLANNNNYKIDEVVLFYCLNDLYLESNNEPALSKNKWIGRVFRFLKTHSYFYIWLKGIFFDRPETYFHYDLQFYKHPSKAFNQALQTIKQIKMRCMQAGWDFSIVLLPYEYQLRETKDSLRGLPQKKLIQYFDNENIKVYDPVNYLKAKPIEPSAAYLFADGIHFSEKGHRLLAEYLRKNAILVGNEY
ncbi:MAG: SGNH/GDSL hydrolase family protein [Bacteroidales bacterium]|nr:SGNH/GDSL hydrolase family protein [Bacteroidales bacterium]